MEVFHGTTPTIRAQELTNSSQLLAWESQWRALWNRVPTATPFQSPEWLIPFWSHLGTGQLWTLAFTVEDKLVGLAPFSIYTEPATGKRQLLLVGTGVTDYLDILLDPEFSDDCFAALMEILETNLDRWDTCDFQQLRSGSALLAQEAPEGWTSQISVQEVCPTLTLPEELGQLHSNIPPRMLEKLRHCRRHIQQRGPWSIEAAGLHNFEVLFERLLALHSAWWSTRGQPGMARGVAWQNFHRDSALRMLISGKLRLYALASRDETVGCLYALAHSGRTYFYLAAFDPAFAPYNPGTLLIGHAIEAAIAEGCTEFDFLRGRQTYKYLWGARGRLNYRRLLSSQAVGAS